MRRVSQNYRRGNFLAKKFHIKNFRARKNARRNFWLEIFVSKILHDRFRSVRPKIFKVTILSWNFLIQNFPNRKKIFDPILFQAHLKCVFRALLPIRSFRSPVRGQVAPNRECAFFPYLLRIVWREKSLL